VIDVYVVISAIQTYVFCCIGRYMLYSDYQVHVMGHVSYVGFATYRCTTMRTRFTFCKKKKKKKGHHIRYSMFSKDNKTPCSYG
jgi:hypothetical protein